jgi:chorismate mutase/prephenate dehydratase
MVFGDAAEYLAQPTKTSVFEYVECDPAALGVIPIENSTEGVVRETIDGLIRFSPLIRQEFEMEIQHLLLGHSSLRNGKGPEPKRVLSHPQALAQCRQYLEEHYPKLPRQSAVSTAQAAQAASYDPTTLAVANGLAAESFGLHVIDRDIADRHDNATRFICIGADDSAPTGRDKTSLVFSTPHERGALLRILSVFDAASVNLTRIESRPLPGKRWEYAFVVDVEGHRKNEPLAGAILRLKDMGALTKVLGSYPRGASQLTAGVINEPPPSRAF